MEGALREGIGASGAFQAPKLASAASKALFSSTSPAM
jgi:hypothetical protein